MFQRILIICVGNICRSPMAEALLADRLAHLGIAANVSSAGIGALAGHPADPISQELMLERELDISKHRARQVTTQILLDSDLILTMETRHLEQIEYMLPTVRGRVHRLGKWSNFDIPDPYQKQKSAFMQASGLIEQGIEEWQGKVWR